MAIKQPSGTLQVETGQLAFPATPAIARSLVSAALLDIQGLVEFLERADSLATLESLVILEVESQATREAESQATRETESPVTPATPVIGERRKKENGPER